MWAYVYPEPTCLHHHPFWALGDITGIKKHYYRKHNEKKWKCEKCSKIYVVRSDLNPHTKTCGTREYMCDCGTLFSSVRGHNCVLLQQSPVERASEEEEEWFCISKNFKTRDEQGRSVYLLCDKILMNKADGNICCAEFGCK